MSPSGSSSVTVPSISSSVGVDHTFGLRSITFVGMHPFHPKYTEGSRAVQIGDHLQNFD